MKLTALIFFGLEFRKLQKFLNFLTLKKHFFIIELEINILFLVRVGEVEPLPPSERSSDGRGVNTRTPIHDDDVMGGPAPGEESLEHYAVVEMEPFG